MSVGYKLRCFGLLHSVFNQPIRSYRPKNRFATALICDRPSLCLTVHGRFLSLSCSRYLKMSKSDKKPTGKFPQKPEKERGHGTRGAVIGEELQAEKHKYDNMTIDRKRKLYKCGENKYITLKGIAVWPDYEYQIKKTRRRYKESKFPVNDKLNQKVSLFQGDITALEIDGIVNAANGSLMGGGGVDGAIHHAAGSFLKKECSTLNGCDTGDAKITHGYKLPAKYVIHTVGPVGLKPDALHSAYLRSLEVMKENQLTTVAFPCISTGVYGYPNEPACHVALETIRLWLEEDGNSDKVERIILCVFLKKALEVYEELMPLYFPLPDKDRSPKKTGEGDSEEVASTSSPQAKAADEKKDNKSGGPYTTRLTIGKSVKGGEERKESDAKGENTTTTSTTTTGSSEQGLEKGGEPMESKGEEEDVWVKKGNQEKGKGDKRNSVGEATEKEMEADEESEEKERKVTSV